MADSADSLEMIERGDPPLPRAAGEEKLCPVCEKSYPADFVVCPRDGARLEDADAVAEDDPLIGCVLGGAFKIQRAIGEGATARVYEASHVRLGKKRFAVKVLHAFYGTEPTVLARFQREAEAAAAIAHPGVVDVYDINRTPDGRFYIVTELLEGRDLATLLEERGKLDVPFAVRIVRQVCRALGAAHARGVVHRDMKPENVFVSGDERDPRVKVLDFGISKIEDGANLTKTGTLIGTPAYMAPEQAAGGKIDARTDLYALGAVMYRALTGRRPFQGEEVAEVLSGIITAEPPRPTSIEPSIPEALEIVIQKAMSKRAEDRHASAMALDAALAAFDATAAGADGEPSAGAPADAAKHARPLLGMLLAAAALFAIAALDALVLGLLAGSAGAGELKLGRLVAVTLAVVVVLAGPAAVAIRSLSKVWQSTPRVIAMIRPVRRALGAAVGTWAVLALLERVLESVGAGPLGPVFEIALALASFAAAGIGYLSAHGRRA